MERKLFLGILSVTLVALAIALLLPGGRTPDREPRLPWLIEVNELGALKVFGITLGESTLQQARENLQDQGKVTLFQSPEGQYRTEAYFQRLFLSGLKADLVLTLAVGVNEAQEMFERGERISQMGSGTRKIELSSRDLEALSQAPVASITFIPAADLDADLLSGRFGEPARRVKETGSEIVHWLYPERGLDIALNPDGKEVFQYVKPADFGQLTEPLTGQE
ncbi:MAG: hypothetical protein OQL28_00905 [Sedimenticola sp.]|nr:hypothetical protein [Sedimenticola sp.]